MGECNTILKAYTKYMYRYLEQHCTHQTKSFLLSVFFFFTCKVSEKPFSSGKLTLSLLMMTQEAIVDSIDQDQTA